jgi:hypothetical protein
MNPIEIQFLSKTITVRAVNSQKGLYNIAIDNVFAGYYDTGGTATNIPTDQLTPEQTDALIGLISTSLKNIL